MQAAYDRGGGVLHQHCDPAVHELCVFYDRLSYDKLFYELFSKELSTYMHDKLFCKLFYVEGGSIMGRHMMILM